MTDFDYALTVTVNENGVRLEGAAAVHLLMRLVLEAKFGVEPSASLLLSPYVETLVDALTAAGIEETPAVFKIDWSNPAIGTPSAFIRAADAVRREFARRETSAEAHGSPELKSPGLEELLKTAMKPYSVPAERLSAVNEAAVTDVVLDRLEALSLAASAAPWFVRRLDDQLCMGAYAVSTRPDSGANENMRRGDWPSGEVVAATLIQDPPYVVPADDRWEENADLIAEARTYLPELVRLARLGLSLARSDGATEN